MSLRPDLPGPMRRRGPRPLLLHLTEPAAEASTSGMASSNSFSRGWPSSSGGSGATLRADPALIRGIAAYRRHPWQRTLADPPAIWAKGEARLLDYGTGGALPVLFVPSLVNRSYVLDLTPEQSMMRWLATEGVRPLLLDWGWPGLAEARWSLSDYIAGALEQALAAAASDGPVVLAGYCMGGLLALAAAVRRPALVRGLALLATPWDFHAADSEGARRLGAALPWLEPVLETTGTLPVDGLQALFAAVEPGGVGAKFRAFAAMDQASEAAARFVALEDWLNDGVPLVAAVARETLGGWYGENTPARTMWRVEGEAVRPQAVRAPCFVAVPGRDRIVPPESALALAAVLPGAVVHRPVSGHIGMVTGRRAEAGLWKPFLGWLRAL